MNNIVLFFLFFKKNLSVNNIAVNISCIYKIQVCSGITSGKVLNEELYAKRLQKLIYLYSLTGCFMKISLQSLKQNLCVSCIYNNNASIQATVHL